MKKYGRILTKGNVEQDLKPMVGQLIKRNIDFNYNNNIIWFYEDQIIKLPEDNDGKYIPCSDDNGVSFYEIKDSDIGFTNIFPEIKADINNKLQPSLTMAEMVEMNDGKLKKQIKNMVELVKESVRYISNLK